MYQTPLRGARGSRARSGLSRSWPKAEGLMFLAGIYRFEEGEKLPVMSILTREPSEEIRFIHDRMPVIFTEKTREAWLDRGADPAKALERCEIQMRFEIA